MATALLPREGQALLDRDGSFRTLLPSALHARAWPGARRRQPVFAPARLQPNDVMAADGDEVLDRTDGAAHEYQFRMRPAPELPPAGPV